MVVTYLVYLEDLLPVPKLVLKLHGTFYSFNTLSSSSYLGRSLELLYFFPLLFIQRKLFFLN